ncbi:peptide ABC transporter substrate-binding protein [Lactiplantibacillus plantarum]|uniref:peptide ABC transporter substrate-binding protein n=1 Tax=Lactiplantibacillus plantarum TaxID=1590 RepID=UPI0007AB9E2B|nr:peptide ABC transporter substrate-binding protein [Lactiplantibacillus plantarum]ASX22761.1 peptide-binding protein [Lactiplantibacillus plantarum]KZD97502.1 Oligopeptide ABC transporter periplasmic oligopeptide-binding protein OppA [Lactiplantibacillus plantarum]KZT99667.1 Oligopeptide ABC transporter periplasmicoligopeptide-binding protein OppA [Lactiplantibacillus plantarum]KZU20886.1 Oligopeptide ABC transporter periplasmicoligopeptide-binding protein OppA [Lactiplantibacillus plantarum]
MGAKKGWLAATFFAGTLLLAGCGSSKASNQKQAKTDHFNYVYVQDPDNFDYTVSAKQNNTDVVSNFEDGLLERNPYGQLTGDLAKSWSVSKDGKTYTYHLRSGVKWVDSEGNTHGTVKAQDFVTGLKHAVAAKSEQLYVVQNSIKGLDAYATGKTKDFSTVGVKALNATTVQYRLNKPETYWNSKLTYGVMYPINAQFLKQKGADFGKVTADSILYNGPYVLANFTSKSVLKYKANPGYWDKSHVYLKAITLTFDDGSNPDGLYKSFEKGNYTYARVYPGSAGYKTVLKQNKNNILWTSQDSSVYNFTFNLNRQSYNDTAKKTDQQKADTRKAILNQNFRLAVQFAFNKADYNAQVNGKIGANKGLRNELTPPSFVSIGSKDYGTQLQEDMQNTDFSDIKLADGQDGTYQPTKAKQYFAKAKAELKAQGVSGPIHLDLPVDEKSSLILNQAKSFKKSVEATLGKQNVIIDLQLLSDDKYNVATFNATTGKTSDFDISNSTGWSPDYDDPSTYLEIYNPVSGANLHTLGLEPTATAGGSASNAAAIKAVGFDQYSKLLAKAEAINTDTAARYKAFAKAEAWLLNSGIVIPTNSGGAAAIVSRIEPLSGPYAPSGIGAGRYKFLKVRESAVTTSEAKKARAEWLAKRKQIAEDTPTN